MFRHAIFFQHGLGQRKLGVEKSPKILSKYFVKYIDKHYVKNHGSIIQNMKALYLYNNSIEGKRINIGGDHSMAIATGAYSLNKYNNTKFIWIDAHADINTIESSETGNFHGMPLGFLTGRSVTNMFSFLNNKLRYDHLLYIGIRDQDKYENHIINKYNIPILTSETCNSNIETVYNTLNKFCANSPVHISFDVDAVDPFYIHCTGTPVQQGLSKSTTYNILKHINDNFDVINMDVCELNLNIGSNIQKQNSLKNTLNILKPLKLFK